jgi:hypothetical protein
MSNTPQKFGQPLSFLCAAVGQVVRGLHCQEVQGFPAPDRDCAGHKQLTHIIQFIANCCIVNVYEFCQFIFTFKLSMNHFVIFLRSVEILLDDPVLQPTEPHQHPIQHGNGNGRQDTESHRGRRAAAAATTTSTRNSSRHCSSISGSCRADLHGTPAEEDRLRAQAKDP